MNEIPKGWSVEAADCINRLLQRKPSHRLGLHGAREVKEHIWFKNFPWKNLYNKKLNAPFLPPNTDNFDYKYCNEVEKQGLKTRERFAEIMIKDNYKTIFLDYNYFNRYDLKSYENKSIFLNIHESMYRENENEKDKERTSNNINENYMSAKFLHYRNNSMINQIKNLNKSKSNKKFDINNININHDRSMSAANGISLGPNQAFWEASIYAKYRKHINKINNNKIILNKQNITVHPSTNIKTNNSVVIQSNNDYLTSNNMDFQNSKHTETFFFKNNIDNSSISKKIFSSNIKI